LPKNASDTLSPPEGNQILFRRNTALTGAREFLKLHRGLLRDQPLN
jgi:hypothetical protein